MFRKRANTPSLDQYAHTVESILIDIGVDPATARINTQEGYGWNFRRGSALIEVYVTQHENVGYFQVLSPLLTLPSVGLLPLYRRLLEMNLQLTNAAFGVYMENVYIFSERPLAGMDGDEANALVNMVAAYADEMDDKLASEFGGRLYGRI